MTDTTRISHHSTPARAPLSRLLRLATPRRALLGAAAGLIGGGMVLNWGWLTAVGAAPIIVSLAPCAAMCGLGLCMKGGTGSSSSKQAAAPQSPAE